jgi:hypothetical protein
VEVIESDAFLAFKAVQFPLFFLCLFVYSLNGDAGVLRNISTLTLAEDLPLVKSEHVVFVRVALDEGGVSLFVTLLLEVVVFTHLSIMLS